MSEAVVPVPAGFGTRIGPAELAALHFAFAADPDAFWLAMAKRLDWVREPTRAGDWSFAADDFHIRWYEDGQINLSVNCLDRHLADKADKIALIFEADEPGEGRPLTYREMYEETCKFANALKSRGIKRGDRVMIYMPMIPEAAAAMLACARIGAVHSVCFGGFSPESLADRIRDCGAIAVITADEGRRGGKSIPLKANVDKALAINPVDTVIVVARTGADVPMAKDRDLAWATLRDTLPADCPPESVNAEDPLFILYTSGSTGKPKGVMLSHENAVSFFDWCSESFEPTAADRFSSHAPFHFDLSILDIHVSLKHGATLVLIGEDIGKDAPRLAQLIADERISIWYSAPSILALLAQFGSLAKHDYSALRQVLFAGEVFPVKHLRALCELLPRPRYFNLYGPTETNVCTYYEVQLPVPPERRTAYPIGKVCSHLRGRVLDEHGAEVAHGSEGELCIAGPGVMQGYWALPEQTVKGFSRLPTQRRGTAPATS